MPGIGYVQHNFNGSDSLGKPSGFCVEALIWARVHQNNKFGPSHVKVYCKFNLNNATRNDMGRFFYYSLGVQLSIERNPKRQYLIPFFGAELGGFAQRELGTTTMLCPQAGVYLLATKNVYVNLYANMLYPTQHFDLLSGYSLNASINFALW